MIKAAIYCRLSKEDNSPFESESIQNQKNMLTDYAQKQGFSIYKIYADDDYSGANINRPGFKQMIADAEEKKFDVILCKSQSRFSRDISVIEEYLHTKFPLWGIRFISLIDNADTEQKSNKKARQINSLINEWYLEDLSENIRAVFKSKMRRGEFLGAFVPYGYKKDENKKNHLVTDSESKGVITFIFSSHIKGLGATKIAKELNNRNISTPSAYRAKKGLSGNGQIAPFWTPSMVSAILKNPVYYGHTVQNITSRASFKTSKKVRNPKSEWIIVENTHEPLSMGLSYKPAVSRSPFLGEPNVLCGKVFCKLCGSPLYRVNTKNKSGDKITYLRCKRRYLSDKNFCTCPSIRADDLECEAFKKAKEIIHSYKNFDELKKLLSSKNTVSNLPSNNSNEIIRLDNAIQSLYIDKSNGIITTEQFLRFSESFNKKKAELLRPTEISCQKNEDYEKVYDDFLRFFIGHALEKIIISQSDKNEPIAEFYWKGLPL